MMSRIVRSGLAALFSASALVLAGCGGSGDAGPQGPSGPPGPPGPPGSSSGSVITIASNATPATDASAAAWAALQPQVTVTGVTIASPPVVTFKVTNIDGTPIVGLGNTSKNSKATLPGLTNVSFALAKLVPGTNGSPSKWVSYIITTVPTFNKAQPDPDTSILASAPTRPGTDNTGTLVDQGLQNPTDPTKQGVYTYTFWRDVTQIKTQVDGMTVSSPNNKADLGDLTYDPTRLHRLTIQISGNAPGTSTNTPTGVAFNTLPGVPMVKPIDVIYDFVPSGGPVSPADSGRDIVATAKCAECHRQLGGIPGDSPESSGAGFHGGSRNDTRYCVVCHNDQRKYGRSEAPIDATTLTFTKPTGCTSTAIDNPDPRCTYRVDDRALGNLPNHIHHIHMGPLLSKKLYDYADVRYNEVLFPQDLRNCTKCHDGSATSTAPTKQGDNWKNVPNRLACGGCHDGINFATGMGVTTADAAKGLTSTTSFNGFAHGGQSQLDDAQCATCHTPGNIDIVHTPVTPPNTTSFLHVADGSGNQNTNAAWIASNTSRLPAGAIKVSYDIKSVAAVADAGGVKHPQIVFRLLQNGARKDLNVHDQTAPSPATGKREFWDGFMGAPSLYFVFAVPQDNIQAPADFNASVSAYLRCIWNGTAQTPDPNECTAGGKLTGPDVDGYYTATLTAAIPNNAVMLTGGVGYSYNARSTLPLTQTNLADFPLSASPVAVGATDATATSTQLLPSMPNKIGGLIVIAPNAQKVATGYTGRRPIVEDARCNACHQELGTFTEDAFHAGQRNDGTTCSWCHTPNRTSSGWSADSTSYIHAIHASAKRQVPFTWHASSTTESFNDVKFPGVLKDCETCHLPGTYNFAASASVTALPNRLYRTVGQGIYPANGESIPGYKVSSGACVAGTPSVGTALSVFSLSPYVTQSTAASINSYGIGFSFNAGSTASNNCTPTGTFYSIAAGSSVQADPTTLVNSPITTACFACHDSDLAKTHMQLGNGSIYQPRSVGLNTTETCMVCHDVGRIADIKAMHAK